MTKLNNISPKVTSASIGSIQLSQGGNQVRRDRLDIQRAQSAVLVKDEDGTEYAIVADDNQHFNDPYWQAMYEAPNFLFTPWGPPIAYGGSASARKVSVGGKLGVVQDPFGKKGKPVFLGATLPLDGYQIQNLSLSEDGQILLGQLYGSYSANLEDSWHQKEHLHEIWNVKAIIEAAKTQPEQDRLIKHLVVPQADGVLVPTPYKAAPIGTFYDVDVATIDNLPAYKMGDIAEIDIKEILRKYLGITAAGENFTLVTIINTLTGTANQEVSRDAEGKQILPRAFTLATTDKMANASTIENAQQYILSGDNDGDFGTQGRLYLIPNITAKDDFSDKNNPYESDLSKLRAGKTLGDKEMTIAVRVTFKTDWMLNGTKHLKGEDCTFNIRIKASDFATNANTFFGDRPLDNPGYSAMTLKGSVGLDQDNNTLDVYRVEQRLKYLGFSAFGASDAHGNPPANIHDAQFKSNEFVVDGVFTNLEKGALTLFESIVNYGSGGDRYGGNSRLKDGRIDSSDADGTTSWLNAYNAPHWMNVYEALGGAHVYESMGYKEYFGSSWMRDWLRGYQYADQGLQNSRFRFNGITDATLFGTSNLNQYGGAPLVLRSDGSGKRSRYGQTPHASHDVGMAFDLGLKDNLLHVLSKNDVVDPRIAQATLLAPGAWSKADALTLIGTDSNPESGSLDRTRSVINSAGKTIPYLSDYRSAIKDFLALYDITQRDKAGQDTGSWDSLPIFNMRADEIRRALFGDGTQSGGMIRTVLIGGTSSGQNPQRSISEVLNRLGVLNGKAPFHHNHFHINLRPPTRVKIGGNAPPLQLRSELTKSISLVNDVVSQEEGDLVLIETIMLAASSIGTQLPAPSSTLSVPCEVVSVHKANEPYNPLWFAPGASLQEYFDKNFNKQVDDLSASIIAIVKSPLHGRAVLVKQPEIDSYSGPYVEYLPDADFIGVDSITVKLSYNGISVTLIKRIVVVRAVERSESGYVVGSYSNGSSGGGAALDRIANECIRNPGSVIKVGAIADLVVLNEWMDVVNGLINSSGIGMLYEILGAAANVTFAFDDLSDSRLGVAFSGGNAVVLDNDAAGHGWYIDPTPLDNTDDYLPTADTSIWMAKPGSAAEGKMDLLSVLLHEYGHVLGLEHSSDSKDFMGPVLPPGMRKLPTAAELQQMASLVAQLRAGQGLDAQTLPDAPHWPLNLPFMAMGAVAWVRRRDGGEAADALLPNTPLNLARAQDQWAINASLQNPLFAPEQAIAGGNTLAAWGTSGKYLLDTAAGSITLQEDGRQQTQVSQAFQVGAQDRFLRFTVNDGNLRVNGASTGAGGPQDAFEVALLDAVTGASLFGTIDTTRTDALLNTQRDAAGNLIERTSANPALQKVLNADGSTTCTIDLRALLANAEAGATGRAIALSFDLIGFGATVDDMGSTVTVSDVRLLSAPLAVDDAVALDEDTPATIDALANDGSTFGYVPAIVAAPAHGTVTLNADGSFTYVPVADYHGEDSFSYQLVDASGQGGSTGADGASNVATVRLTVNAVNGAPVIDTDTSATTAEDTVLGIALQGHDLDGDTLTWRIVTPPQHGSVQIVDGQALYTPAADYHGTDSFGYVANDGRADSNEARVILIITPVNDAPVISAGQQAKVWDVAEDGAVTLDLAATATDVDGDVIQVTHLGQPQHGTVVRNPDGTVTYRPEADYNGADSFSYTVSDGQLEATVTLNLQVTAVNDAPVAQADTGRVVQDGSVTLDVLANDRDVDTARGQLTARVTTAPAHGQVVANADGTVTYTPEAGFHGSDSFAYVANDGELDSAPALVSSMAQPRIASLLARSREEEPELEIRVFE